MTSSAKSFFWYELMTTDLDAAEAFYSAVLGWRTEPFDKAPGSPRYIVVNASDRGVGGLMELPDEAAKMGVPTAWMGYFPTKDIDASVDALKTAGGAVHRPVDDIPGVGRFAVVADPQGAAFMFLEPNGPDQPPVPQWTPGHVGWHELYTSDWQKAFDFYSGQFSWTKGDPFDMGPMGIYQPFAVNGGLVGGIMNKPEQIPVPVWLFYFNVTAIDAAAKRVTDKGGKVVMGPMEVPNGQWIVQCTDPQGAYFALISAKR